MKTKVVVVIPNWNGTDFIKECLSSLLDQTSQPQIIVVDNGSEDNSVDIISKFKEVELIKLPENTGFAGGVNSGITKALEDNFKYIALFNNDALADKNWVETLIEAADQHPEAGIITGKFVRLDKKHLDSTGDIYTAWGAPYPRGRNQIDSDQYDKPEYVFSATGGASLYRAELFKDIGKFDEDFFAYYEDVDISFRAQLAGWKVWYEPKAMAYHHIGGTSSKLGSFARYHSIKNYYLLLLKNLPLPLLLIYSPLIFLQSLRILAATIIKSRSLTIYLKAMWFVIKNIPSTIRKRIAIQRKRKISLRELNSNIPKSPPPIIPKI